MPGRRFSLAMVVAALSVGASVSVVGCDDQQDDVALKGGGASAPGDVPLTELAKDTFEQLKPELVKVCGQGCHNTAVAFKAAPTFLKPPDEYASIKASTMVTEDPTASPLLNKNEHEGPSIASYPELATKVFTWLRIEASAMAKKQLPASGFQAIVVGPNEIDMSPAGVAGVKIRFDAAMPSGILSLTKIRIFVPDLGPKKGVKLTRPLFYRLRKDNKLYVDPVDTFSYVDGVFPGGGVETQLPPGSAIFAVPESWTPFQAGDKLRIQMDKFELGDVVEVAKLPSCKNAAMFQTQLMPTLTGTGVGGGINCSQGGCHGGQLNPRFVAGDAAATCVNFGQFIDKANPGQSRVVLKPSGPNPPTGHAGGKVTDTAGFANAWTQAIAGGQIFE